MPPLILTVELSTNKPPPAPTVHPLIVPPLISMVEEFSAYKPPPHTPLHPLIVPPLMVMVELSAYKPPPLSTAVHPLIVPLLMVMVELSAYKPPPNTPSHPLIVPPLMVMVEEFSAHKPPPLPITAVHPLIVPPSMINFELSLTRMTPSPCTSQSSILPPSIRTVAPESAITARLHFLITPPCMLKTDFEPIITMQALPVDFLFCSVTFSYIFAVAPSDTVTKATCIFASPSPSIVSFLS